MNKIDAVGAKANVDKAVDVLQLEKLANRCEYKFFPLTCKVAKNGGQPDPNVFKALDWLVGAIVPEYDRACRLSCTLRRSSSGCVHCDLVQNRKRKLPRVRFDLTVRLTASGPRSASLNKRIANAKEAAKKKREEERRKREVRQSGTRL
jgi:hypothetical protein